MNHFKKVIQLFLLLSVVSACNKVNSSENATVKNASVSSPGNVNTIQFSLDANGTPFYMVKHKDKVVIDSSSMGFDFKGQNPFKSGFVVKKTSTKDFNETWEMPWGEQRKVVNNYKELLVELEESAEPKRALNIYFRAYDDGIGFRYEFPKQNGVDSIIIMDENTQFQLTGNHLTWWNPGDWDSSEHLFHTDSLASIDALALKKADLAMSHIVDNSVLTPVTMRAADGVHLAFHEANLTNYAGMTLKLGGKKYLLTSELVGSDRLGYKAKVALPFATPWRTIQIADKATQLLESRLIENLNEPNKIGDVSYFKPMKYVGIWWEMHLEKSLWDLKSGKHGATTANAKKYIDFASKNGFKGLLVEGWNTGWESWTGAEREGVFDFVTPYPDYDINEVVRYGKEKGVGLIMHNETSAAPRSYDKQLDTAYKFMKSLGIHGVKTGYVGTVIPKGEYHDGQWMVNHYQRVVDKAAENQVAVDVHEPIKPTGLRRTYPNLVSAEGARGQEFNAWASDGGNPPGHMPTIAFTRMLSGPFDFTPGIFDITLPTKPNNQVNTTIAQQLALYVVIYSPVQMAADLPENYVKNQPALQFIREVGVDWEQTKVLNGEVGEFVTVAREEKETGNWFVGAITNADKRDITVNFDFLPEGKKFKASIYKDGKKAHYKTNPTDLEIEHITIDKNTTKTFTLAEGGGFAISLIAIK